MFSPLSDVGVGGLVALGAGVAVLGLALLLGGPSLSRGRRLGLLLIALLTAGLAALAPAMDETASFQIPLLALAGTFAACPLLASSYPKRFLTSAVKLANHPQLQGLGLFIAGSTAVVVWPWYLQRAADRMGRPSGALATPTAAAAATANEERLTLWTDRAASVVVRDLKDHRALPQDEIDEAQLAHSRELDLHLLRTGPADRATNCHGWVFTGGRYVVDGADVERIVQDNGYVPVETPRAGNLVVYRTGVNTIIHTAVVRVATDDGLILLESKWTSMGHFLHAPEDYTSTATWTYYRSPRSGHLLRGLNRPPSADDAPAMQDAGS